MWRIRTDDTVSSIFHNCAIWLHVKLEPKTVISWRHEHIPLFTLYISFSDFRSTTMTFSLELDLYVMCLSHKVNDDPRTLSLRGSEYFSL